MKNPVTTTIAIIYSGDAEALLQQLQNLRPQLDDSFSVIILNNGGKPLPGLQSFETSVVSPDVELPANVLCNILLTLPGLQSKYILFLNDTTRLWPNHLQILQEYINTHPEVTAASPLLVYPDGRIKSAGGYLNGNLQMHHLVEDVMYSSTSVTTSGAVEWLPWECLLLETSSFRDIGGFNVEAHSFPPYLCEVDIAYKLRQLSKEIHICTDAVAVCHGAPVFPASENNHFEANARANFVHTYGTPTVSIKDVAPISIVLDSYSNSLLYQHAVTSLLLLSEIADEVGRPLQITCRERRLLEQLYPHWQLKRALRNRVAMQPALEIHMGVAQHTPYLQRQGNLSNGCPQVLWDLSISAHGFDLPNFSPFSEVWGCSPYACHKLISENPSCNSVIREVIPPIHPDTYAHLLSPRLSPKNFPMVAGGVNFLYVSNGAPLNDLQLLLTAYAHAFGREDKNVTLTVCAPSMFLELQSQGGDWNNFVRSLNLPAHAPIYSLYDPKQLESVLRPGLLCSFDFIIGGLSVHDHLNTIPWEASLLGIPFLTIDALYPAFAPVDVQLAVHTAMTHNLVNVGGVLGKELITTPSPIMDHLIALLSYAAHNEAPQEAKEELRAQLRDSAWSALKQHRESLLGNVRDLLNI